MRALVIARTAVGRQMSAPGIRALNVARTIAAHVPGAEVMLAVPNAAGYPEGEPFEVRPYTVPSLPRLVLSSDVIVAQYIRASVLPFVLGKRVVLDFFANFIAEWLELWGEWPDHPRRNVNMDANRRYLNLQLSVADLILAANERQRDLWVGAMAATGRITPAVYDRDPTLRSLIDTASFGVRPEPAMAGRRVLKGVYPGIGAEDFVLIWNGGVVHWYDPTTLLQAMAVVARARPRVKLFFLGTKYPIDDDIEGRTLTDMLELSRSLGLAGRNVFVNDGWVDYGASGEYLIEADAGVCTYLDNLETQFAQRVRLIDLIWAETPVICSEGDEVGEMVRERQLGITVPHGDVNALAEAIIKMADDAAFHERCRENERAVKPTFEWQNTLAPLIRFCRELPEPSASRSLSSTALLGASYGLSRLRQGLVPNVDRPKPRVREGSATALPEAAGL